MDKLGYSERKFHSRFVKNHERILPRSKIIASEFQLYKPEYIMTRDIFDNSSSCAIIGKVDLIFRYRSTNYCAEIKVTKNNGFWDALKVFGYIEYYKWQTDDMNIKPAIIYPFDYLKFEHQIIAGRCGVSIFAIGYKDDNFTLKLVDDDPYWKQLRNK